MAKIFDSPFSCKRRQRTPVNIKPPEKIGYSGFVILRLPAEVAYTKGTDLLEVAKANKLQGLSRIISEYKITSRRLIRSLPPEEIQKLESKAKATKLPPLHSLTSYWRLDCRGLQEVEKIVNQLNELPEVDIAYREMPVSEPVVNDADDPLAINQDYLGPAPTGIDARWAWTQPNGEGAGVGFMDLEQGWVLNHEDLVAKSPSIIYNDNKHGVDSYKGNHGTAVLGEVVGVDNTLGIVGIAPAVTSVRVVSHYEASTATNLHVADAIVAATAAMPPGDVLLLEVQRWGSGVVNGVAEPSTALPTETDAGDFDAIRLAVALGIIVVEAAGNGNSDLDAWTNSLGQNLLDRNSAQFRDSGAIMVGSAVSTVPHNRYVSCGIGCGSNYGSRVDCYGWGENITTLGYGDLAGTTDTNYYTDDFGGTSGASPMIVGCAIILQGMYQSTTGNRLSPTQMRELLSDTTTGTPQGAAVAGNIGVMPNLQAIATGIGLVPDVYVRDYVGDSGIIPSTGSISASPDVIVVPNQVTNPTASYGEGSGTENSNTLGYQVEAGQDNYIYVRMRNRGLAPANGTTATVYWSPVSTLVTPDMWILIGSSQSVNVPVGDTLVVTNSIVWKKNQIPGEGHYCFVATLDHPQDPTPPIPPGPPFFDWTGFTNFIRNNNNVTWRNFNVVDVSPDPLIKRVSLPFSVAGAPDIGRIFDFEIQQRLPSDVRVWLEMPVALHLALPKYLFKEVKTNSKKQVSIALLPKVRSLPLCNIRLSRAARYKCRLIIQGSKRLTVGSHSIAIRQVFEGFEVGRVTWVLRPRKKLERKLRK